MKRGAAPKYKELGSSPAKVDLTRKPTMPMENYKPSKVKKSTTTAHGQLDDAEAEYQTDLLLKQQKDDPGSKYDPAADPE